METADLDSDGDLDVLFATRLTTGAGSLQWYESINRGEIFHGPIEIASQLDGYTALEAGDIDGDGDTDVLASGAFGTVWYENGNGRGDFASAENIGTRPADALQLADVNGDGDLDLLMGRNSDRIVAWYENLDQETQFSSLIEIDDRVRSPRFGDVDGDSDLDIVGFSDTSQVLWYENTADKGFGHRQRLGNVSGQLCGACRAGAVGDLDGDNDVDIVVWSFDRGVQWLENTLHQARGPTLAVREDPIHRSLAIQGVQLADMDDDGDLDMLARSRSELSWLENDGAHFSTRRVVAVGALFGADLAIADLDQDGMQDVVAAVPNNDTLAWYPAAEGEDRLSAVYHLSLPARGNSTDVGDLDGDDTVDLLIASRAGIFWRKGLDGFRQLSEPRMLTTMPAGKANAIDMDHDGDLDIFAGFADGRRAWYENMDGRGSFSREPLTTLDFVAFGDLDGDGDLDGISLNELRFHWHETQHQEIGIGPVHDLGMIETAEAFDDLPAIVPEITVADVDGDDDLDLVATPYRSKNVVWHENRDGKGSFGPGRFIAESIHDTRSAVADFDGDQDMDIVVSTERLPRPRLVILYENVDGNGKFVQENSVSIRGKVFSVADINADGFNDLVTGEVAWLEGSASGGLDTSWPIAATEAQQLTVADLDGDTDLDVLTVSRQLNGIVWYESDLADRRNAVPGDVNFDNAVTFADFLTLSANFGKVNAQWREGDLDADGVVTLLDFEILAQNLGIEEP